MQLGNHDTAVQILDQALSMAEPEGYRRTFLDEGQPIAALLYQSIASGTNPTYAGILLKEFSKESAEQPAAFLQVDPDEKLIEPLSDREQEVLALIAEGLSNQEIAERLYLSLSTVKSHASHIYDKLNVSKRTQAVSRARSLGLLPIL
jgi:LuxR family maltose regulon positive regulatory protein